MLGQLLGESTGKRIVRRVLAVEPPQVEVTFEDAGKMLGVATFGTGSYTSTVYADGSIHGGGQGFMTSADGDMITWTGSGVGRFKEGGAVSYRGVLYYRTQSQKLAALNNAVGVFEYEIDPEGKTHSKIWEWK